MRLFVSKTSRFNLKNPRNTIKWANSIHHRELPLVLGVFIFAHARLFIRLMLNKSDLYGLFKLSFISYIPTA